MIRVLPFVLLASSLVFAGTACDLLPASAIEASQGGKVIQTKPSIHDDGQLTSASCYFQLAPDSQSVSLEVLSHSKNDALDPVAFWHSKFDRTEKENDDTDRDKEGEKEAEHQRPPERVSGIGEDAYWVDTGRDGALYVLRSGTIVRLSLGGKGSREEKKTRTVEVAKQLRNSG